MLKNLKRASAIMLSLAMAVQFGMADTYYANTLSEEPIIEETQEQEPVTVEEGSQQVAVEQTEAPAIDAKEEFVQVPETKSVTLSYVAEDGTILRDATTHEYEMGYSLNSDASVMLNFDGYTLKDVVMNDSQIVAAAQANLNVTSDLTSVKFVYQKVMTESHPEANEAQEENKTEEKTEEDAEADPEAKEELPEYPAFDMSATAGNVTVHVTAAEGVLPSGAQLIVKRVTRKAILNAVEETVTEKDKEVDSAIALDITIVNADGIEIQPNGIVNVSFENVAVGGEEVNVYHVTDDASTVTEVATNTQSFDANHFSIYVITGEKKVELTTFNFVANEQNVSTQIVKTGDTLITPTAPDIAGKAFVEWQENGSKFDGFGVQTITKTETRTITAKYEDALYVYFYNPEGTKIMRTEKVADHKDHNYSHVSYDVDATHKLVGWAADQNGTTNIAKNITVPKGSTSVNVYAIIKEGYWVTFDSDGGSAIDSQFVFDKISLNDQTTPTKPGYSFGGWYNGTEEVENGTQITKPMALKAHWTPKQVSYTVIHWWENADDDEYSFQESENKTGLTGTEANAKAKSYEGFTAQPVTKKTIKGDGSTIVSVYYKRNIYKVEFFDVRGRTQYKDLTIEAKYGQDISKQWPTKYESSSWLTKPNGSTFQANIATMPLYGAKFYGPKTGYGTETASYYVQVLPGETGTVKMDGIQYKLDHKDASPGSYYSTTTVTEEDQYPLKGYAFNKGPSTKIGQRYDGAKFYYTRNSYDLKFINNGKQEKTVSKKYEQSISSENYTPTRPSALPEYYVFDGWYENELCEGEAFNFTGKKMPAQNVTLYAKWTASDVKFTYNLNNPEGTVDKDTKKVEAGTVASTVLPSIPTINEYSFAGWYYADGNGNITSEVFNTNNTITRDTSIVGKWLYKGELRVVYDPGTEKDVTVPTDDRVYAGGARVTVAGNATTTSGKKFLGWELNGNVYKPGQSFEVNKDIANKDNQIILTATWGNAETSTTLTYNPGNGRGNLQTVNVMNNEAVEIEAHGSLGFSAPVAEGKEYYFAGWADSKTGNATYADGQTINIDANGENVLYAVWVEKAKITVVAKSDEVTYDGNNHVVDGFNSLTIDGYTVSGLSASVSGTDAGTYNNVITGEATVTKDGKDVTNRVVVTKQNGTLTINKRQVTLTSEGGSKPYDGTALTKPDVAIGGDGFVTGEVTSVQAIGTVTEVKDSPVTNAIEYTVGTKFNINNYEISMTEGTLSITPKSINPDDQNMSVSDPQGHVYDGLEHKEELEVKDIFRDVILSAGTDYDVAYSTKDFTNVGKIIITITGKGNYTGTFDRTYEITPATLTVTTPSVNKVYDGTPLTAEGTISGFVNKETATFTTTGSQTEVGSSSNTYSIEWDGTAKSSNYKISETVGTLTVTENENEIVVTTKHSSYTYDGLAHGTEVTVSNLPKGYSLDKATSSATATDVTTAIEATCDTLVIKNAEGKDVTNNLKITKVPGSITITPATLTVTTPSANKVYDGTPLTADGTISGFVNNETATFTTTGSQTEVGNSKNTYSIKWNGTAKSTNYQISEAVGTLTVTQQSIDPEDPENNYNGVTINKPSNSVYDGKEHKWSPAVADKEGNALVEGTDYEVAYSTSDFRNVTGTITVTITGVGNYTGKVTRTYEITPKAYTVTTDSANKVYDGTALTAGGKIEGIVDGENVEFKVTGSQTNKGTSKNTYSLKWNGSATETNYKLAKESIGDLTVTEQTIDPGKDPDNPNPNYSGVTINKPSNSVYDGKEHKWSPAVADKEGNALVEGTDYEVAYSTSDFRNVTGTITVTITGIGNYTGKVTRTYEITPKAYTVTTESAQKVYDGTALTAGGKIEGIVDGENVEFKVTGSQTNKGTSKNTYSLKWNGSAIETNYALASETIGDLTVTEQTIDPGKDPDKPNPNYSGVTINKPSDKVYDGKEHKWSPAVTDKEGNALTEGTDYEVAYSTEDFINVTGTITVTITGIGNYTGKVTRTYEITPKAYTVTTKSAKKVYDGTALTAGGKIEGIVDGEVVVVHTTGSQTEVGSTPNTYKLEWKKASSKNYKLKEDSIGTLTVTEQTIDPGKDPDNPNPNYSGVTINNPSNSVYDGKEHKWSPAVTDKEGNALVEGTDYEVAYSTSDFTNVTGTITVTITGIGNYTGKVTRTYEITPKAYTVTTESAKKVYDGTALTAGGKIEGIVSGETVEFTTTGSRTDEGTSKNTYSLKWNGSAIQTNYKLAKESIGDLTVTPKSIIPDEPNTPDDKKTGITVSDPKDSKYDGQEHREVLTVKDTKTGKDLIANKDYTVVYSDDLVNAGTVKVTVTGLGNYSGSFTKTYKITKRLVTLTSATVSKTYDGQALKNTSITVSGDGFVEGEGASYEVTGTQTSVGNSANAFEYKLNENTLASNYDITKVVGTLTITAAPAPVTPPTPPTSPTPVSPPPVTPRYIQQVVPAPTPQEEVKKEKTPKAEPKEEKVEKVEKEKTPKARPEKFWALINLICAIVTVLFGLLLLISKRHKNKDDEEDETKDQTTTNEDEEKEQEKKRGAFTRVLAVLIAILSVVFFLVTEDLSLRWTWTDQWTIWMVVIGLVQIVVFFVGRKWKNVDDDEDEQAQQA